MLCFSPGRQLPLLTGRLCFSQEEKTPVERAPRGSPASPPSTARRGLGNRPPPALGAGQGAHGPAGPWQRVGGARSTRSPLGREDSGRDAAVSTCCGQCAPRAPGGGTSHTARRAWTLRVHVTSWHRVRRARRRRRAARRSCPRRGESWADGRRAQRFGPEGLGPLQGQWRRGCEGGQVTAGGQRKEAHPHSTPQAWATRQPSGLALKASGWTSHRGWGWGWCGGPAPTATPLPAPSHLRPTCAHPASARAHSAACLQPSNGPRRRMNCAPPQAA